MIGELIVKGTLGSIVAVVCSFVYLAGCAELQDELNYVSGVHLEAISSTSKASSVHPRNSAACERTKRGGVEYIGVTPEDMVECGWVPYPNRVCRSDEHCKLLVWQNAKRRAMNTNGK